ncbi:hypothetical protein [Alistipes sp. ZOR0009]|nr:hypothetical protein [Alistipes sp. ZOR0009]
MIASDLQQIAIYRRKRTNGLRKISIYHWKIANGLRKTPSTDGK